jgi:hypothetical protein
MAALSLAFSILAKDNASKEFDRVGDSAERAGKKGDGFGSAMKAGVAAAGVAVAAFAKSSVQAFVESEQSSLRLDEALRKFPKTADVTRASFDQLNAALAAKTKFDDDATASGQAVLAQFGLTGQQIQELTPLLQDYAARTGKDLPGAAEALGKAVLGQGRALKEVGIDFQDTGSAAGNFDQIMGGLRKQVGGFAEAEGKTAAGQAAILTNRFGEVQEQVGAKLVPVLSDLAGKLITVIGFLERNKSVVVPLTAAIGGLTVAVLAVNAATAASSAVTAAASTVRAFFTTTTVAATGVEQASTLSRIANTASTAASTVAMGAATVATAVLTAAQTALNAVMRANPIGLVITLVAALVAGIIVAYRESETFRNIVNAALDAIKRGFGAFKDTVTDVLRVVIDKYLSFVATVVDGAAKAFAWVPGLGERLRGAAGEIRAFRDAANIALEGIKDKTITVRLRTEGARDAAAAARNAARGDGPGDVGGRTLQRVLPILSRYGGYVTSTYRTPEQNRRVGGSPRSYHLDRNNPAVDIGGPTGVLDRVAGALRGIGGWRELLWRVAGHFDHIHVAHAGGTVSQAWPTMPGWGPNERPVRAEIGEEIIPRGGMDEVTALLGGILRAIERLPREQQAALRQGVLV